MKFHIFTVLLIVIVLQSCGKTNVNKDLESCPIVAIRVVNGEDTLVTCNYKQVQDTIDFPLSRLVDNIEIVRLENTDSSLVNKTRVAISDSYILIKNKDNIPYKLFTKKGKYVAPIGRVGQGPGEYIFVYDEQIDEANDRIYLLPWNAKQILTYNLKGEFVETIPLCFSIPKGLLKVDGATKTVSLISMPFSKETPIAWTQTMDGKLLREFSSQNFLVPPDFSNELESNKTSENLDFFFFTFTQKTDTLYHYDGITGLLHPKFNVDFKDVMIPIHDYMEHPGFYIVNIWELSQIDKNHYQTDKPKYIIIDRNNLKGSYVHFKNDFLGNISIDPALEQSFRYGYYAVNYDPGDLSDMLDEVLKNNENVSDSVISLRKSISENDNNYIIYGKLK